MVIKIKKEISRLDNDYQEGSQMIKE